MIWIKIENFKEIIGIQDTYGYFSLGHISGEVDYDWFGSPMFGIKCECSIDDQVFKILIYKIGFSKEYIVLSDFSGTPDIAVVDNETILKCLKEKLNDYLKEHQYNATTIETLLGNQNSKDNGIVYGPYMPTTDLPTLNQKYDTVDSISSASTATY